MENRPPSTLFGDEGAFPRPSTSGAHACTPTEALIARVLAEVLCVDRVDLSAHFVDVGGDSLVAMKLMTRLAETFGFDLPPILPFEASALRVLAARLDEMCTSLPSGCSSARNPVPGGEHGII